MDRLISYFGNIGPIVDANLVLTLEDSSLIFHNNPNIGLA